MPLWFPPVVTEYGNDCLTCYAAGLTPLNYYASFSGIQRGDLWLPWMGMPPVGWYQITQKPVEPCRWQLVLAPQHYIWYSTDPATTTLLFDRTLAVHIFRSLVAATCRRFHSNFYLTPVNNFFWDGVCLVFTPAEAQAIVEKHTPVVDPDPLLSVVPTPGGEFVVSYIDQWGDTKFKMKVDSL